MSLASSALHPLKHQFLRLFLVLLLLLILPLSSAFAPSASHYLERVVQARFSSQAAARFPLRRSSSSSLTKPSTAAFQQGSTRPRRRRLNQSKDDNDDTDNTTPDTPQDPRNNNNEMSPTLKFLGKTTSTFVAGTFFVVLAWKRDALMVSFFVGAISNGILSKVLKKLIRQERPMEEYTSDDSNDGIGGIGILESPPPSDNGMPSSHAMSLGFIGTFTGLLLAQQYHPYSSILLMAYATISLWYRIESKLHTWEQVAVGVTVGSINAVLWRCICFGTTQPFTTQPPTHDLPIHFMDFVTNHWLNEQGVLPIYGLAIPLIAGALIVGSVERRIGRFLKMKKEEKEQEAASKQA